MGYGECCRKGKSKGGGEGGEGEKERWGGWRMRERREVVLGGD